MIASDEIFTKIADCMYPHDGWTGKVEVKFVFPRQISAMVFVDCGIAFNLFESQHDDISSKLTELSAGEHGILMVKKLMDSAIFKTEKGHNILTCEKNLLKAWSLQ